MQPVLLLTFVCIFLLQNFGFEQQLEDRCGITEVAYETCHLLYFKFSCFYCGGRDGWSVVEDDWRGRNCSEKGVAKKPL